MFFAEAAAPVRVLGPAPGPGRACRIEAAPHPSIHSFSGTVEPPGPDGFSRIAGAGRTSTVFNVPFFAGEAQRLRLDLRPPPGATVLIEARETSRLHKATIALDAAGRLVRVGDEILEAATAPLPGGGFELRAAFLPFHTRPDFLFLHFEAPDARPLPWRDLRWQSHATDAAFRSAAHPAAVREEEVISATRVWALFRDYLHLEFELHRPGARLAGLALESALPLDHASWWTCDAPEPGGAAPEGPNLTALRARRPRIPFPSPALMDLLGPEHGLRGHCVRAVLAEPVRMPFLPVPEGDAVTAVRLHARWTDGARTVLTPQRSIEQIPVWRHLLDRHVAAALREGGPGQVFLELGARGPVSEAMRREIDPAWRYVGTDIEAGPNVDVVADAHRLSDAIPPGSVGVCYSNSVLEHLLAPERLVVEANRVLRPGGLFVAVVPCAWPLHAEPWDFGRFTHHKWPGLLNEATGFRIEARFEAAEHALVPLLPYVSGLTRNQHGRAPSMVGVAARKVGEARADWTGWRPELARGRYDP